MPGKATEAVFAIADAAAASTASTTGGSIVVKWLVQGSLAQVWGMINGMQLLVHVPTLNVDFPAQAFIVIS